MRVPSRFMPKYEAAPVRWWQWIFPCALLGACAYLIAAATWWHLALGAVAALALAVSTKRELRRNRLQLEALAERRPGDSICQFARSFERRTVDTWVIRAVYEELADYLRWDRPDFPVHADDNLGLDLKIDSDELDDLLIEPIALRSGRTLDNAEANPLWGKVSTARDLVLFFNAQPRAAV
jgi:hypothetical protein